jgi:hypothetical protein
MIQKVTTGDITFPKAYGENYQHYLSAVRVLVNIYDLNRSVFFIDAVGN